MKFEKSTFHQYEDQRDVRLGENANSEAGPSQPKSRKRKALVDERVDTPVAKRSRFLGASLVFESPPRITEIPGYTIYPAMESHQRIFKSFDVKPCGTKTANDDQEPVKPTAYKGNGTKQTFNSDLLETRGDCNDAPAATATKSNNDFSPFAQASLGSEAQLELKDVIADWSTPLNTHEEQQVSAAPAEISPWMFLAPGAEVQEDSAASEAEEQEESEAPEAEAREESVAPKADVQEESAALVAEAEIQPAVASSSTACATESLPTKKAPTTSQQPASEVLTPGLLARVRGVPPAYVNTQSINVETLLSREVTTAVTFTQKEKTTFLNHVGNGDDMAAMEMLPEEQRFSVLDTPESIAAYRAVRPPSASLENVEDRLWVCRAVIKVKLDGNKTVTGIEQMRKHCKNAVGSKDSVARHWRRTHLKLGDVKKATAASSASGSS
ncbi:hypothetical protein M408DRAFT_318512 [Serendipita vermifera MAFF 305830]|uniref:Uncharacterized protein n=1 Tax=Serendipita vermifera MAFF 305830 TaxID=933852 RepID=A0A0C2WCP6_SERVB|nr:hypothetical protein M408DRAFT_318512 [Serendipita vermifera MAFF 305830]